MSGAKKALKSAGRHIEKFAKDPIKYTKDAVVKKFHQGGDLLQDGVESIMPDPPKLPEQTIMPMPDEEELRKARRRKGSKSYGRSSTILSQGDGEGLGG